MSKLINDIHYMVKMNDLGEHLKYTYNLTEKQVQEIKHKMHIIVEETIKEDK